MVTQWHAPGADPAVREFPVNGYVAVVLEGEAELRAEWCGMRNCVLDYAAGCAQGTHRVVSLRERDTGTRVMSIVLKRRRGGYVVADARRRFNRPAGPELAAIAERAAAIYAWACEPECSRRVQRCRRVERTQMPRACEPAAGRQAAFDFEAA